MPTTLISGILILVGLVGIAVPVLPGLVLVWLGVGVWAVDVRSPTGWAVLAVATALTLAGFIAQYLIPGRRLRAVGVPRLTTLSGVVLAIVGFFVIPVVGAFAGFVLGVYLAECARLRSHRARLAHDRRTPCGRSACPSGSSWARGCWSPGRGSPACC